MFSTIFLSVIIRYYATFVLLVYNRSLVSRCCCVLCVKIKILFLSSKMNWMTIPFFRDWGWCKSYSPQTTQCVNINAVTTLLLCTGHCRTWKIPDELDMRKSRPSTATQEKGSCSRRQWLWELRKCPKSVQLDTCFLLFLFGFPQRPKILLKWKWPQINWENTQDWR